MRPTQSVRCWRSSSPSTFRSAGCCSATRLLLVVGSVLAAAAQNAGMFIGGHVLQGLATSMLLIAAAPPLTIGFPKDKLRHTAVIMNMCVFGAVALGPFIGGVQAEAHAWRPLFWIVAAIALMALVMAALTFDDAPPADLDAPARPVGHRAGGGRLCRRLHRRRATHQPRIHAMRR